MNLETYNKAIELLQKFVSVNNNPCQYDHHGYCQGHFLDEKPCFVEEAKQFLEELKHRESL